MQILEFMEKNGSLTTDSAETQQINDTLWEMEFLKFLTQSVPGE